MKNNKQNKNPDVIAPNTILKLTISGKKAAEAYQRALKILAKTVKTPGFRQGKVPPSVAEKSLNPDRITTKALDAILPAVYNEEIKKSKLKPIAQPEFNPLELELGKDWVIEAHIAQKPEIKIQGYEKIAAKAAKDSAKKSKSKKDKKEDKTKEKELKLQNILKQLILEVKPKIPELLVKRATQDKLERMRRGLENANLNLDDYLKKQKMSFQDLGSRLASEALTDIQIELIFEAIAKAGKLEATTKEVDTHIKEHIKDAQQAHIYQTNPQYKSYLAHSLTKEKVIQHLLAL